MNLELSGKNILITGSSQGIGLAIAVSFLEEHANVILNGRDKKRLEISARQLIDRFPENQIYFFQADMQNPAETQKLAEFTASQNIELDHLVCNIGSGKSVATLEEDEIEWRRMLDINLMTAVNCVKVMLPCLKINSGLCKNTSIIFISSICAKEALGCPVAYSAAKNALVSYAKNIARPLGNIGIRVNIVSPGNIVFPGSTWEDKIAEDPKTVAEMLKVDVPLQRIGTAEEVADVVVFLASERATFVTGAEWIVDGGQVRNI